MIARLQMLWAERSPRERQLLLVMFALLAIVVLVFGVLRPLNAAKSAAFERLERVSLEAGQIAAEAETLRRAGKDAPPPIATTLVLAVSQSAGSAGFNLATLDPQGDDRVSFTITNAKSPALFAWIRALSQQGIFVEQMTLRTNIDATLAAEATVRLRKS